MDGPGLGVKKLTYLVTQSSGRASLCIEDSRLLRRFYHVTVANFNNQKLGKKLCKMLHPHAKKKWNPVVNELNSMPSIKSLTKVRNEPNKQTMHRIATLNKLFMKYITDIMSTGTPSLDIVGRGIEISKVHVSLDLQRVNVFWVCKGNDSDEVTERLLNRISGPLRHELSILRLMGEVPFIVFLKDKEGARVAELDRRLAIADYGEDYEPTDPGHLLKSEFTLSTQLSPEVKAKLKQLEESSPTDEDPLPEMTHNVFGLNHSEIHNRIMAVRKKTISAWNSVNEERSSTVTDRVPAATAPFVDSKKQKQELADFLQKRQIELKKLHQDKNSRDIPLLLAANQSEGADNDDTSDIEDEIEYDPFEEEYFDDPERMQENPGDPVVRI